MNKVKILTSNESNIDLEKQINKFLKKIRHTHKIKSIQLVQSESSYNTSLSCLINYTKINRIDEEQ